ncbi:hypothetical protein V7S43_017551 [Phytophthora oleae]|uniref:Bzip transcription factor n=1 Tax=Phytophthora oleae TaxID=2107226 RepID=A0ABD3ETT5_9STRA
MKSSPNATSPSSHNALSRVNSMDCVLQPPNSRLFSDEVIGGVVQRSRPSSGHWRTITPQPSSYFTTRGGSEDTRAQLQAEKMKAHTSEDKVNAMAELVVAEKLRLRELRRVRQIRYRKKKENYASNLDEENRQLQKEIEKLEQKRRSALGMVPSKESGWSVTVEYFRLFQYGVRGSFADQMDFLRASMAPTVVFDSERGVEAMMKSWQRVSRWFPDIEIELDGVGKYPLGIFVATTTTTFTMSEETIRTVFPELWSCGSPLVKKLLGKKIVMRGSTRFEWDSVYCRVIYIRTQVDLLTSMLQQLGDLETVARVFEKARVTLDFRCKQTSILRA